jgi:hypothetical protein
MAMYKVVVIVFVFIEAARTAELMCGIFGFGEVELVVAE